MASDLTIHFMEQAELPAVIEPSSRKSSTDAFLTGPSEGSSTIRMNYKPAILTASKDGKVVGSVTCHQMDDTDGSIGRLAVDLSRQRPKHRTGR